MESSTRANRQRVSREDRQQAHRRRTSAPSSIGSNSEEQERGSIELQTLAKTGQRQEEIEDRHSRRSSRSRNPKEVTGSSKKHSSKRKLERRHSYSERSFVPLETIAESAEALRQVAMDHSDREVIATLGRQSKSISRELQTLLDAQSDGLMKALGGGPVMSAANSPEMSVSKSVTHRPASSVSSRSGSRELVFRDDPMASTHHLTASSTQLSKSRLYTTPSHVTPVRQPAKAKPPNLKQARKGIAARLKALSGVKDKEAFLFDDGMQDGSSGTSNLENMTRKRSYLEVRMQEMESATLQQADEERELASEERALEEEISRLEARLEDLKVDLKFKRSERHSLQSEREAAVSSWKNALAELDRKIKEEVLSDNGKYAGGKEGRRRRELEKQERIRAGGIDPNEVDPHAVWSLPESRRTIEMVKESVEADRKKAEERSRAAKLEAKACREGAALWEEVVERVETLESQLQTAIAAANRLNPPDGRPGAASSKPTTVSPSAETDEYLAKGEKEQARQSKDTNEPAEKEKEDVTLLMQNFFADLDAGTGEVAAALAHAVENGWSLLEVAIGAELQALHTARELLGDALVDTKVWSMEDLAASQRTIRPPNDASAGILASSSIDAPSAGVALSGSDNTTTTTTAGRNKGKGVEKPYRDYEDGDDDGPSDHRPTNDENPQHRDPATDNPRKSNQSTDNSEVGSITRAQTDGARDGASVSASVSANATAELSEPANSSGSSSPEMERVSSTASASRFSSVPLHRRSLSQQLIQHEKEQEQDDDGAEEDDAVHDGPDPQLLFGD